MSGAADAAHTEVERDTDAPASVNLHELLLPQRALPSAHRRFAVAYNAGLLEGWAKQSSPACAAGVSKERGEKEEREEERAVEKERYVVLLSPFSLSLSL